MARPAFAFKRGYRPTTERKHPEHDLQVQVRSYLGLCLPRDVEWTSSLAGAHLGAAQRTAQKAAGLQPGWPDLQFCIRRRMYFIELKAPLERKPRQPERLGTLDDPDLSPDQRRVLAALHPDAWAICRSLDEVATTLVRWGVALRSMPGAPGASRYE